MDRQLETEPTLWGLSPTDLHARFWASRGVQVVVPGRSAELVPHAELFLLSDPRTLAIFRVAQVLDTLSWLRPVLCTVRIRDPRDVGYREEVETDGQGRFVRFRRMYRGADHRVARVHLTRDQDIAQLWQNAGTVAQGREILRRSVARQDRYVQTLKGQVFNASDESEVAHYLETLISYWQRPDASIDRIRKVRDGVWADVTASVDPRAAFVGPVWVGAGRTLPPGTSAVGPSLMWDLEGSKPDRGEVQWIELEVLQPPPAGWKPAIPNVYKVAKRAFDIGVSLAAILATLPLYLPIMIAIKLEDGGPVFFAHNRQTLGGREFGCIKFRSMKVGAEAKAAELQRLNLADGPQVNLKNDPRITKVGNFLRKYQLDELPQFFNSLKGDMSIVGPRPSPDKENQYSPEWREARLSVRPGITGLWQIKRTRTEGNDFKEWIMYDLEYVKTQSFWLDMKIIYTTIAMIVRGFTSR